MCVVMCRVVMCIVAPSQDMQQRVEREREAAEEEAAARAHAAAAAAEAAVGAAAAARLVAVQAEADRLRSGWEAERAALYAELDCVTAQFRCDTLVEILAPSQGLGTLAGRQLA
jgi:hypothetical protein